MLDGVPAFPGGAIRGIRSAAACGWRGQHERWAHRTRIGQQVCVGGRPGRGTPRLSALGGVAKVGSAGSCILRRAPRFRGVLHGCPRPRRPGHLGARFHEVRCLHLGRLGGRSGGCAASFAGQRRGPRGEAAGNSADKHPKIARFAGTAGCAENIRLDYGVSQGSAGLTTFVVVIEVTSRPGRMHAWSRAPDRSSGRQACSRSRRCGPKTQDE